MKISKCTLLATTFLLSCFTHADFIGLKGDVNYWYFNGSIDNKNNSSLSNSTGNDNLLLDPYAGLSNKNDIKHDGAIQASIAFEHPIPLLPNIKIKYTDLNTSTNNGQYASNKVDLTNTDYILYYEILDNIVSADIGLGMANIDGKIKQYNALQSFNSSLSDNAPIAYASVGAKLPFTGLSAKGEVVVGANSDVTLTDVQAELQYDFVQSILLDVGAKVGYRYMYIDVDENKTKYKLDFNGPYIGLNAHF